MQALLSNTYIPMMYPLDDSSVGRCVPDWWVLKNWIDCPYAGLGMTIEVQSGIHYTNILRKAPQYGPGSGHIGKDAMSKVCVVKKHIVQRTHCPRAALSEGRIVRETHCPRNALSKGSIVQGPHCPRDVLSKGRIVQGTHCPRNGTSETFRLGSFWLRDTSALYPLEQEL
jgi:hypothetical protein